ncbi:MAG: ABC transporter permease [Candidatus Kapaibacterium sp.]|nr:ABC transporter permease [Bacteroidota bacterium]
MKIPFKYILRNFYSRKLTTTATVLGMTLVVVVFTVAFMMGMGIRKTLSVTGSENNALVVRKSSQGEISSIINREVADIISSLPQVAKSSEGKPLISTEPVVIFIQPKKGGGVSNLTVRGVTPVAFQIRDNIKLVEGKTFGFGSRELIVGKSISKRFNGVAIGDKVKLAGDMWTIVGVFDAGGSGFDSEVWGDSEQLLSAFQRTSYSTITFRLSDPKQIEQLKLQFDADKRLKQFTPEIERTYFSKQSNQTSGFIMGLGVFITLFIMVGAIIGAMITMFTAVANRTTEIGTLRALGFTRGSILISFLFESLLLSVVGCVLGLLISSTMSSMEVSTINFQSFSEIAFNFTLNIYIVLGAFAFSIFMGLVGGFLPSWRASRLKIIEALRAA